MTPFKPFVKRFTHRISTLLTTPVCLGKPLAHASCFVFFPYHPSTLNCGLSGILSYHHAQPLSHALDMPALSGLLSDIKAKTFDPCTKEKLPLSEYYLGGEGAVSGFRDAARELNRDEAFVALYFDMESQNALASFCTSLESVIKKEKKALEVHSGKLTPADVDILTERIECLMDTHWCLHNEISSNIAKIRDLIHPVYGNASERSIRVFKKVNSVLNAIDRLEVRGRDSAGISLLFTLTKKEFESYRSFLIKETLYGQLKKRTNQDVLLNNSITIHDTTGPNKEELVSISFAYKVAAEIGSLGDNVYFLRHQLTNDSMLQVLANRQFDNHSVSAHTRWASVGAITESNCHPVDNESAGCRGNKSGIIHVCLNGDIDNYRALKDDYEDRSDKLQAEITTDTKIIPMQIESYLKKGHDITQAFLNALNDFEGSHAISMHTDLAPGKLFLAQRGSGQAVFVGLAKDHFMSASEVYGFVEETPYFLKMDGEKIVDGKSGKTQGQVFILDQNARDRSSMVAGIQAMYYDGTPITLTDDDVKNTQITSRDIDRQNFPHYFLKEITESPVSVEKTIRNRWKIQKEGKKELYVTSLDETVVPPSIVNAFKENRVRRIFLVGQGTAGVAALACSSIMSHYISDPAIQISAHKASEFSGFMINEKDSKDSMNDSLVIAISQSGTTTDTNLAVDMVRDQGAYTLAIVNRRDSDLTFKVDGVIYTSSGRDIEMSVASTKAFYSQIVAGAILGLHIAALTDKKDKIFVSDEIKHILALPQIMKRVLELKEDIRKSASTYAVQKTYWAAVGSGANKASSDEIRIKLSELCYKTISSDYVEDKKHIDLSSEPLIIVCAAGTRESVLGDIIKDTAIFHAHKALPIVITTEGEERFDSYAKSVFHVPVVPEHFAPIVNTLAGHLWGYYAALSINEGSRFVYNHREELVSIIDNYAQKGMNVYEVFLESRFREKVTEFYNEFRKRRRDKTLPTIIGFNTASDLTLLLKYLSGKLPVSDFEIDFAVKGTPLNMLDTLFDCINETINCMARPIDAIKHQAKTVTVGTSRISEKVEGILFEILDQNGIALSQLTSSNVLVMRNLQGVIEGMKGLVMYKINNLSLLGQAGPQTTVEIVKKEGVFENIPSRVETDNRLKGTKSIIVREGNVFIGKGLKDNRNILTIPILSKTSNVIEYLLSINVYFKDEHIPLFTKVKALGGKHERIRNIIQEAGIAWDDKHLEILKIEDLFGLSAEKIGEQIVQAVSGN